MAKDIVFPEVVEQPVMWGYHRDLYTRNRYKALVDADTGKLFSIVSQDYRLIRREVAVDQIEAAISANRDLEDYLVTTEFYNDGGRMRRKYIFSNILVEIQNGDQVNPELQLLNSYDSAWPLIVLLGAFRLVCGNGLVVGKKFFYLRKRHVQELDRMNFSHQVSTALQRFERQTQQWKRWTGQLLTLTAYTRIMETMRFGIETTQEIGHRINQEADDCDDNGFAIITLWAFFNILTWYITHKAASLNHQVQMEKRLRMAMEACKN